MTSQPSGKRVIVDAQVHLWKAESPDWPWVKGATPQMPEPFTIEKLVPLMDEAGVDRAVIVPPSWPGDRNDYGLEQPGDIRTASPSWAGSRSRTRAHPHCFRIGKRNPGCWVFRVTFLGASEAWLADGTADWFWPRRKRPDCRSCA
jgi:hypothetical protein